MEIRGDGGMSKNHTALDWRRWQRTRKAAFERDSYRCTRCSRPGRLEAHHEPPLQDGADPYNLDGIRTLCRTCHIDEHSRTLSPEEEEWKAMVQEFL